MSILKVKTASGFRYEVSPRDPNTGKRLRRRFARKIDAQNFLSSVALGEESDEVDSHKIILMDEAEFWLKHVKLRFSESHYRRSKAIIKKYVSEYGYRSPSSLNSTMLFELQMKLRSTGLGNSSVNRITEVFCAIARFSVNQGRMKKYPFTGFKKLKVKKEELRFWSEAEVKSFLDFTNSKYSKDYQRWTFVAYLLVLNTALRSGEVWGLKVKDLVFKRNHIWVKRQFNRVTHEFGETKGKKERLVPMNNDLKSELKKLVKDKGDEALVFSNDNNLPINHDNFVKRKFHKDIQAWSGKPIRFHDLRHTSLTLMVGSGLDIKTVQEIAGHKDIKTTMIYVHLLGKNLEEAKSFSVFQM